MIIFALVVFIGMLVGAGMAVDFMRYETTRSRMQATLDRSILAAAALNQPLEAEAVVTDYFAKSGLDDYTLDVTVDEGINFKTVSASVSVTLSTFFLNIVGIDTLVVGASGAAEERINKLEIVLVLDVSGSMGSYSRLTNLKAAAKSFVQQIYSGTNDGDVSISIVPYNHTVILSERVAEEYNLTSEHDYSRCARFDDEDFLTTEITPEQSLERLAHFDKSTTASTNPIPNQWFMTRMNT